MTIVISRAGLCVCCGNYLQGKRVAIDIGQMDGKTSTFVLVKRERLLMELRTGFANDLNGTVTCRSLLSGQWQELADC